MFLIRSGFAVLSSAALAVAAPSQVPRDTIAGSWSGTIALGSQEYPIRFWFKGQNHRQGNLQILGVMSKPSAVGDVALRDARLSFTWASTPPQRFVGKLNGNVLVGSVTIEGIDQSFAFNARRMP